MARLILLIVLAMTPLWGQPGWARQDDPRLDELFARLKAAADPQAAQPIEQSIWEVWIESGDEAVNLLMLRGIRAMGSGNYPQALIAFNAVIEAAPDFAEGWNKRATLYWLMGDYQKSVEDIDRTLALEPRHFGALSGLAMIREAQNRPKDALDAFKRALAVHPQLPFAEERLRRLNQELGEPI